MDMVHSQRPTATAPQVTRGTLASEESTGESKEELMLKRCVKTLWSHFQTELLKNTTTGSGSRALLYCG